MIFCSKNYAPILSDLHQITARFITYFHYTITACGHDVEPGEPSIAESMETLKKLSGQIGRRKLAWRYDPVLLTQTYTVERHLQTLEFMARELAPYVDRCILSFVEMYKKLTYNMPELIPLPITDQNRLAEGLGKNAQKYDFLQQTCGTNGDFTRFGIHTSGYMTLDILGQANGVTFRKLEYQGMREGCHCMASRDIGAYDTCMNGC